MDIYLSHISAANFWQVPCIEIIAKDLHEKTGDKKHFTFTDPKRLWRRKAVISYLCQTELPSNALVSTEGFPVSSPELLYLQLANCLKTEQLILLGLQLCSHPPGKSNEALSSKQKLCRFMNKIDRHRGKEKAIRSLKYIENGSASVMESLAFMILTLPNFMGGYGLKGATFNQQIELNSNLAKRLEQKNCFVDLYFKDRKIAVEYDSFAWHQSPSDQGRDALRTSILKRQGIEVYSLSTIQLYDEDACKDFAYNLAKSMDKRIQIRSKRFPEKHLELRRLLPRQKKEYQEEGE